MKKSLSSLLILVLLQFFVHAQVAIVATTGSDITIKSGTVFFADNLILTPSADFTISNNTLTRATTAIHTPGGIYIARVYQFNNSSNPYSGAIQINYQDGAELNGIAENLLTLNIHNGTGWNAYVAATRDGTNNFVLTDGLSTVTLNELTLANQSNPLPLLWKSFNVTKQYEHSLLQWSTYMEQGSNNFLVQYSTDGFNWINLATIAAAGNSSSIRNYNYLHVNPIKGVNYYRIIQNDLDNRSTVSEVKQLRFEDSNIDYTILGNPVSNNILSVEVYTAGKFSLYDAGGKLIWNKQLPIGIHLIDISMFAKGVYIITNGNHTQKISLQ